MWYRSDRADYIKSSVITRDPTIRLFTGETAESLMLYPMQKFDYAEPLLELLMMFKSLLLTCKYLIVVGYSFRDEHIRQVVLDAASRNRQLTMLLVDPVARQIYESKLRHFDSRAQIESSLSGRVVCLPYRFERVFPFIKDHYLSNLRQGLNAESNFTNMELRGESGITWETCLRPLASAEYSDKVLELLSNRISQSRLENDWQLYIEFAAKTYLNLEANGQTEAAAKHGFMLKGFLRRLVLENALIQLPMGENTSQFTLTFNVIMDGSGGRAEISTGSLSQFLKRQYEYI